MARVARRLSALALVLGSLGCGAAEAPLAPAPRAVATPSPPLPRTVASSEPPGTAPGPQEPPQIEAALGSMRTSETPLTPTTKEADFGCEHVTDERLSPPLHRLEVTTPLRLWASTGPAFPSSLVTRRALLAVTTTGEGAKTLACGASLAVDLEPGRYWVRGQTRTNLRGDSGDSAAPVGFVYRLSEPGDSRCPAALATYGLHDRDGEFPFEVAAERIDADSVPDVRVDYQLAYTSAATRLLVTAPYPACLRVVADGGVARARSGSTHGHRDYRWAFRTLHPVEGWGGWVVTEYDARYSPETASYELGTLRSCHEAIPDDSPVAARERERRCEAWLRAADRMTWPYALVTRWLDAPPGERERVTHGSALASPTTSALLRSLDEEGRRAELSHVSACAPRPGAADFAFQLTLRGADDDTNSREVFVLVSRRSGNGAEIAGVFEQSPCAPEEVPSDLAAFVEAWREQPWSAARAASGGSAAVAAAHARLHRAHREEPLEDPDLSRCATSLTAPTAASWLYRARLPPPPALASLGAPLPSYFVWRRRGASFVVTDASDVKPAHCE